jgi:hypothetical protein
MSIKIIETVSELSMIRKDRPYLIADMKVKVFLPSGCKSQKIGEILPYEKMDYLEVTALISLVFLLVNLISLTGLPSF